MPMASPGTLWQVSLLRSGGKRWLRLCLEDYGSPPLGSPLISLKQHFLAVRKLNCEAYIAFARPEGILPGLK